jgi:hypothetical protein
MLQQVRECAAFINSAPGGAMNQFVPKARNFFADGQWRQPEVFAERWKDVAPKQDGPKEMTLK